MILSLYGYALFLLQSLTFLFVLSFWPPYNRETIMFPTCKFWIALLPSCWCALYANWIWVGLEAFRAQVIHRDKPNVLTIIWCALISLCSVFLKDSVFFFLCLLIKYTCYLDSVIDFIIWVCWKMDFFSFFLWFNISKQRLLMIVTPVLGFGVWMLNLFAWLILIGLIWLLDESLHE